MILATTTARRLVGRQRRHATGVVVINAVDRRWTNGDLGGAWR
jgi:hypothetical protein